MALKDLSKYDATSYGMVLTIDELNALTSQGRAVTAKHGLIGFGSNFNRAINQQGIPGDNSPRFASFIPFPEGIKSVAISTDSAYNSISSAVIKTDGTLWTWGTTTSSIVGRTPTALTPVSRPGRVGTDDKWVKVSAGNTWMAATQTDGTLWSWGAGGGYRNGDTTTSGRSIPTRIGTDSDWSDVFAGSQFGFGVKTDGTLWSWGVNTNGMTGQNTTTGNTIGPKQVGTGTDWLGVKSSCMGSGITLDRTLFIKSNGTIWGTGYGSGSVFGNNSTANLLVPTQIGTDTDWTYVNGGQNVTIAIKSNGRAYVAGRADTWSPTFATAAVFTLLNSTQTFQRAWGVAGSVGYSNVSVPATFFVDTDGYLWTAGNVGYQTLPMDSTFDVINDVGALSTGLRRVGRLPGTIIDSSAGNCACLIAI